MLRRKQRLFQRAKHSGNWNTYRDFQRTCRRVLRRAEWNFINGKIQEGLKNNNSKPFWNFVKSRKQDNIGVSNLMQCGKLVSDSPGNAKLLLEQFKSVFTQDTDTTLPPVNSPPAERIKQIKITTPGVAKLLKNLKPGKAPGPDNIPNQVLKACADQIANALRCIYQKSLDTGTLPADWREANISCVFKKGDRHLPENYRPISLTSVPCKILEHIIYHHLLLHLESNNVLTHLNHGFRSGFSCESQLLTTAHDLLKSFDRKKQVDIAILDFPKAFDTVPHRKLLHKLSHYGIAGSLHHWLTSFLTCRTMRVVLEGSSSETTSVVSGVPQGTVLGPLLFFLHINDLPNSVKSNVRLFADDCLLYRETDTFRDHHTLQHDLRQLERWAYDWGMIFNPYKCYILSVNSKTSFYYQLSNSILKHVQNNPYLGILLSNDLKWDSQITAITKKANSTLSFPRRNLRRCPLACKQQAYISLVRPLLEYGAIVWDPYLKKDITSMEKTQGIAARIITGDFRSNTPGSVTRLLEVTDLPPLQQRRQRLRLALFFRVVEGLVPTLPPQDFLQPQKQGHLINPVIKTDFQTSNVTNRYARNNNRTYVVPHCATEKLKNFFIRTAADWNQLDNNIVHSQNEVTFKTKLAASPHQ